MVLICTLPSKPTTLDIQQRLLFGKIYRDGPFKGCLLFCLGNKAYLMTYHALT